MMREKVTTKHRGYNISFLDEDAVCYIDCEDDWKFVDEDEDFGISDIYDDTRWPPTSHVEESASSD